MKQMLYYLYVICFAIIVMFLAVCSGVYAHPFELPKSLPKDSCLEWALGEDWENTYFFEVGDKWNKLHKDIFEMYGYDYLHEAIAKIKKECKYRNI